MANVNLATKFLTTGFVKPVSLNTRAYNRFYTKPCDTGKTSEKININKWGSLEDFYSIFLDIKRFINDYILEEDANTVYSKKPCVNIRKIAKKIGLKTEKVQDESIDYKRVVLRDTTIYLNKESGKKEQSFSIARVIFHFIFSQKKYRDLMPAVSEKKEKWEKGMRADRGMAVSANSNIEDVIAGYFAANVLLPIERFVLWEDKTDEEIARAFKVVKECVQARRKEIPYELELLAPEENSFDSEDTTLLSFETVNHTPEG
jgi:Zn-dependent peptidase ImmA (M78 family)